VRCKINNIKRLYLLNFLLISFSLNTFAQVSKDSSAMIPLCPEALSAVRAMFRADSGIPLNPRIVERYEMRRYFREKIVFTGSRGDRVSAYLGVPKEGEKPYPIVLQFHVVGGSKDSWWTESSFERGQAITDSLLKSGIAVLALDVQYHGERVLNNDFMPPQQLYSDEKWYYKFRDGMVQTIGDYFRAVEYLGSREEIDTSRIGVIGHSMGGVMTIIYASLDKRVKAIVASVAAYTDPWLYPIAPINIAGGIHCPTLVLAARNDNVISLGATDLFFSVLAAEIKQIEIYDSGHRLPEENISRSFQWLAEHLQNP
jgi:dienelactone hydrolase